jgi:uncharacterized protein YlxP (DUF503 family)
MVVGVSSIQLFFPENHSLKDKRHLLTKIVEKTRTKFNISIMTVDQNNLWQRASIGFSVVGVKRDHVSSAIESVHKYVESLYLGEIIDSWTEIIVIGDEL